MANVTEIAPDVFRISIHVERFDLQFNHFLIRDEEPLLFHTGMRGMFPDVHAAVGKVLRAADIRWIGFSHFEADECGALNEWLRAAPNAQPVCSQVGAMVNVSDFAERPPRGLGGGEVLETGSHRLRFIPTPHLPHGWDAGVMFEEATRTLLCSDLFHQGGNPVPVTESDVIGSVRATMTAMQQGPLMDYMPFTAKTEARLADLAALRPRVLAAMHGSTHVGDGEQALRDLGAVMREILGGPLTSGDIIDA